MIKRIRTALFLLICIFVGSLSVSAKEVNFYFYPNGGTVSTKGFEKSYYGYLTYNGTSYAQYTGNTTIKHINSMKGVTFTIKNGGTPLVKGREWYFKSYYTDKIYFLSESKTYKIDDIFEAMEEPGSFSSIDLYAHWSNNVKSGTDIKPSGGAASTTPTALTISASKKSIKVGESVTLKTSFKPSEHSEEVSWSSSNKGIATVSSGGKVTGVKEGKVIITGKSTSGLKDSVEITVTKAATTTAKYVHIIYDMNNGALNPAHGSEISTKGSTVLCNGSSTCTKIKSHESLTGNGLCDVNNSNYINLKRSGYHIDANSAWSTKADGSGKTYGQAAIYKASEFCDASSKDCTVTLYANWKKNPEKTYRIALIGNSKTRFGSAKYPNSKVSDAFQNMVTTMGKSAEVTVIVKGGSSLIYKAQHDPYRTEIINGTFDYVVLQEKTDFASDDLSSYKSGAKEIIKLLKNKNAKIYIRSCWPRKDSEFDSNVSKMTKNAKSVANAVGGTVINDAKAFQAAKNAGINTHIPDNNHPTAESTYLTAACIYKYIFNESATSIKYYHGLDQAKAAKILQIADNYC